MEPISKETRLFWKEKILDQVEYENGDITVPFEEFLEYGKENLKHPDIQRIINEDPIIDDLINKLV